MSQKSYFVISALGPDKPGLVASLTELARGLGANVEDSRMAIMGAEFGVMMLLSGGESLGDALASKAKSFEGESGLALLIRPTKSPEEHRSNATLPYMIYVDSLDQEGIVAQLSQALYKLGVNIVSLETSSYNAPITGSPLFRLEAKLDVPSSLAASELKRALNDLADEENFDVNLTTSRV